ncbi:MAG: MarR family winged helix-turn-helix transcriptional regulator [Yoonia sp.]|uniref:MarR family winged helix-turn-helix transcriptional regulator n=1 Tax=Yoonia sp. TaxID=2212373 RepID=UPI003267C945
MSKESQFQLSDFMPYLLNRAAEATSLDFQRAYKDRYGMLRTEWRVLFHLGRYGDLTAKQICEMSDLHKTKVSRAVSALENRRFLTRSTVPTDRRHETLSLTSQGQSAFVDLQKEALDFNENLMASFSAEEQKVLRQCLEKLIAPR